MHIYDINEDGVSDDYEDILLEAIPGPPRESQAQQRGCDHSRGSSDACNNHPICSPGLLS